MFRLMVSVVMLALLGLGSIPFVISPSTDFRNVTDETVGKVQLGQTEAEVQSIFGGPANQVLEPMFTDLTRVWVGDDQIACIDFGESGKVSNIVRLPRHQTPSAWDRIKGMFFW
jgi:hypothetical protein